MDPLNSILSSIPEKLRPYCILAVALLPYVTRAYHALVNGGGIRSIWNSIWFGTNTPPGQSQQPGARVGPTLFAFAVLAGALALSTPGCSTAPTNAYKAEAAAQLTVDAAMTAWGDYVAVNHPGVDQETAVKNAFIRYQAAELFAIDATAALAQQTGQTNSPGNALAWINFTSASAHAEQAMVDLFNLLRSFGVKLPGS